MVYVRKVETMLKCNLCGKRCQNMIKLRKHTQICLTKDPDTVAKERAEYEGSIDKEETKSFTSSPEGENENTSEEISKHSEEPIDTTTTVDVTIPKVAAHKERSE